MGIPMLDHTHFVLSRYPKAKGKGARRSDGNQKIELVVGRGREISGEISGPVQSFGESRILPFPCCSVPMIQI